MSKEIKLTRGYTTTVDDEFFEELNKHKWHVVISKGRAYAIRTMLINRQKINTSMHTCILGEKEGYYCDHIDGDSLNNQKNNLRFATRSQNGMNQRRLIPKSSRYKGVSWNKNYKKWRADIRKDGKTIYLGSYDCETDAARAYDWEARKIFVEYACLNFPFESNPVAISELLEMECDEI